MAEQRALSDRRAFLIRSLRMAGGAILGSHVLQGLLARQAVAATGCELQAGPGEGGYGALQPAGPELALPSGFTYQKFGVTGTVMSDGRLTPTAHDGMASFPLPHGNIRLVRNHEIPGPPAPGTILGDPIKGYDLFAGGGTTSLEVKVKRHGQRQLMRSFVSLSGTLRNCAGGPTPWGSWLSCEETTEGTARGFRQPHGYCFEVPADRKTEVPAVPLKALGRFVHEAVAVDPETGIVYETEDRTQAGFYRFLPDRPGVLVAGGRLQMLAIAGSLNYDTSRGQRPDQPPLPVVWVDIPDPDPADAEVNPSAVFEQGLAQGGARFRRLEGCWYGGGRVYFNATNGGDEGLGQVWEYQPGASPSEDRLALVFESTARVCLDSPDNLTVSPRGGILICEDGSGEQYLRGLTADGKIFDFALNLFNDREFAGATFSPDGETLFVNIQGDVPPNLGMTFAIWGPWEHGAL